MTNYKNVVIHLIPLHVRATQIVGGIGLGRLMMR